MNARPFRVLVLMATYNGAAHLGDQVQSILTQRNVDVRLVVRDDGSSDGTVQILRDLAADHPNGIAIMRDEVGPCGSAAANFLTMLGNCTAGDVEWIALADQDDIWFPDKLAGGIEQMVKQQAEGYSSDLIAFSDAGRTAWQIRKGGTQRLFDYLFQGASAGCTYIFSQRALKAVRSGLQRIDGRIPSGASHDWIIYALCRSAGLRWFHDSRARIAYRQHSANVYGAKAGLAGIGERIRMMRSHWYRNSVLQLRSMLDASPDEARIFARVERLSLIDRFWLARHAGSFRRDRAEACKLSLAFLTGLFK